MAEAEEIAREERQPFIMHCRSCRHEWAAFYLPLTMNNAGMRLMRNSSLCPMCAKSKNTFVGPLPKIAETENEMPDLMEAMAWAHAKYDAKCCGDAPPEKLSANDRDVARVMVSALRAYAAREDVVERCARAREAHYEKHGFGETPIDGFEIAAMQAALAAFLGEET